MITCAMQPLNKNDMLYFSCLLHGRDILKLFGHLDAARCDAPLLINTAFVYLLVVNLQTDVSMTS